MVVGGGTRQSWGWGRGEGRRSGASRGVLRGIRGSVRVPGSRRATRWRRDASVRTRARGEGAGAPNPDVGGSGRARGDGTGTTRAGDGRTSSSSDFSRMRSSRSLCVSRSCFLSAACARARRGWSGSIAAPASPSASGSNSGLAPSSYSGPSELLMARRRLGDRGVPVAVGGEARPCAAVPCARGCGGVGERGVNERQQFLSSRSARPHASTTTQNGARGKIPLPLAPLSRASRRPIVRTHRARHAASTSTRTHAGGARPSSRGAPCRPRRRRLRMRVRP